MFLATHKLKEIMWWLRIHITEGFKQKNFFFQNFAGLHQRLTI